MDGGAAGRALKLKVKIVPKAITFCVPDAAPFAKSA